MGEWISVDVETPAFGEDVIAWSPASAIFKAGCVMASLDFVGDRLEWSDAIGDAVEVTHWMPLPEPPEDA